MDELVSYRYYVGREDLIIKLETSQIKRTAIYLVLFLVRGTLFLLGFWMMKKAIFRKCREVC
jgi:hypothetical protein